MAVEYAKHSRSAKKILGAALVGSLAIVGGLGSAGLGGHLDVRNRGAPCGSTRFVDRHPHAAADEFQISGLHALLDQVESELGAVLNQHRAVLHDRLLDDPWLIVAATIRDTGNHRAKLQWGGQ